MTSASSDRSTDLSVQLDHLARRGEHGAMHVAVPEVPVPQRPDEGCGITEAGRRVFGE
jgi:hypothetical protein